MASQDITLSPVAETSLSLTARLHEFVVTVDHKKLGLIYISVVRDATVPATPVRLNAPGKSKRAQ
jgi:hypothetical protein